MTTTKFHHQNVLLSGCFLLPLMLNSIDDIHQVNAHVILTSIVSILMHRGLRRDQWSPAQVMEHPDKLYAEPSTGILALDILVHIANMYPFFLLPISIYHEIVA
ncbi:hypothetical protein L210DRAFT_3533271, partial [Boletus edulis BED1]